jgi:Protein of unknown function (DUF2924)
MPRHRDAMIELGKLEQLSRAELRALWAKELAEKPPQSLGRDILALGIAYARQERLYGGLSRRVAKELDRLLARALADGNPDTPRVSGSPLPRAGTILVREWQGTPHHVTVTHDGFLWNGKAHRSLSSIAHAITGTKWNGPRFFGLRDARPKSSETRNGG